MKFLNKNRSLYTTLGVVIFTTVVVIISVDSMILFLEKRNQIISEMKHDSKNTVYSIKKHISHFMSSYSINDYDKVISTEMLPKSYLAIVVEDYNMGKILGETAYVSGKIRINNGNIVDFIPDSTQHIQLLRTCFYTETDDIVSLSGKIIGAVSVCVSSETITTLLNKTIKESIYYAVTISAILFLSLLLMLRLFIVNPISQISHVMRDVDDDGIPLKLLNIEGSVEFHSLSKAINNMISAVRKSRIKFLQQNTQLVKNKDRLDTLSMAIIQSPVSIIISDPDNIVEYVNPQFLKMSGYLKNEIIGFPLNTLFQEPIYGIQKLLSTERRWNGELTPLTKSGKRYKFRVSASSIALDDGEIKHYVYVAEDITQSIHNEEVLRYTQKMEAIGQLSSGIAHDFNNILGIIIGNLELLNLQLSDRPKEMERVNQAMDGAERGAKLTRKLLDFSRQENQEQQIINVNESVENLKELISKSFTSAIEIKTNLADDLWKIKADRGDLEDALLNLSLNARDAMPHGGKLVFETTNKYIDSYYAQNNPSVKEGEYVMLSVSDTGDGIDDVHREKIFDPFFSTKEFGKGSGLGLSMAYGFVQRSRGHLQLYSEIGRGSSFHMYFPRELAGSEVSFDSKEINPTPGGNETILIVDDELELAAVAENYLHDLGYKTIVTHSASEALEKFSSHYGVDLIFSDVVMPSADGYELSFEILKQHPETKILLTSGFTLRNQTYENGELKIYKKLEKNILLKPYNRMELATAIRNTLDES